VSVLPSSQAIDEAILARIREAVLETAPARAVYLFGSRARGTARPNSDYDVLAVVWDASSAPQIERAIRGRLRDLPIECHIMVKSPGEFEWRKRFANTIEQAADREGIILYMADSQDERRAMAQEWLQRGAEDLSVAQMLVERGDFPGIVCFHAQQCVEKCLKGFLTFSNVQAERTHLLEVLLQQCAEKDPSFEMWTEKVAALSKYAVETRYPGKPLPSQKEAQDAVALAQEIQAFMLYRINRSPS
jgi:HEPN domain-containing protein/predicted nucleotidyltransferase